MNDYGTLITTPTQFQTARVFVKEEPGAAVYTIAFNNLERKTAAEAWAMVGKVALALALIFVINPVIGVVVMLLGLPAAGIRAEKNGPFRRKVVRTIEVDSRRDELRLYRRGKFEASYALSALHALTVDNHPDVELEKARRQEQGKKGPGDLEYVHCLFGWFGTGGSTMVELMHRVEWPTRHSLREIREAIDWVRKRVASGTTERDGRQPGSRLQSGGRRGRGAPLD